MSIICGGGDGVPEEMVGWQPGLELDLGRVGFEVGAENGRNEVACRVRMLLSSVEGTLEERVDAVIEYIGGLIERRGRVESYTESEVCDVDEGMDVDSEAGERVEAGGEIQGSGGYDGDVLFEKQTAADGVADSSKMAGGVRSRVGAGYVELGQGNVVKVPEIPEGVGRRSPGK